LVCAVLCCVRARESMFGGVSPPRLAAPCAPVREKEREAVVKLRHARVRVCARTVLRPVPMPVPGTLCQGGGWAVPQGLLGAAPPLLGFLQPPAFLLQLLVVLCGPPVDQQSAGGTQDNGYGACLTSFRLRRKELPNVCRRFTFSCAYTANRTLHTHTRTSTHTRTHTHTHTHTHKPLTSLPWPPGWSAALLLAWCLKPSPHARR
jgi:hypothetical protein